MFHGTVKGGAILTALMLVAVCLSCMVPAVTEGSAAETGTSESVVIEIDVEDKTLAEIIVDYATAYAEKEYYESMDRDVVIVVPDVPGMPADAAHVVDRMNAMLVRDFGPSAVQVEPIGKAQAEPIASMQAQAAPADAPATPSMEPAGAHDSPATAPLGAEMDATTEIVQIEEIEPEEPEIVQIEEIESEEPKDEPEEAEIVQAGSTGIEPDSAFIEEVLEYLESLGDESLDATVEALRAYLNARYVLELNDSLVRTLDDQRDEEPDDSDGPVLADEDEEEPDEPPSEPATEPETPSAPCKAPVYRMGVTTSGLL